MKTRIHAALIILTLLAYFSGLRTANAYYDPGTQRWLNRDPVEEIGFDQMRGIATLLFQKALFDTLLADPSITPSLFFVTRSDDYNNVYLFIQNSPIGYVDLFGLEAIGDDGFPVSDKVGDICKGRNKPNDCPEGTLPIDKFRPKLTREQIHDIKDGIGAGGNDWVGIDKNGHVRYNEDGKWYPCR